ncbi:MAG: hypothetical protein JST16_04065 [Bdellovibrionales bacterium]|nr:hypothetical protein [Bdellovibrionales bacterium]
MQSRRIIFLFAVLVNHAAWADYVGPAGSLSVPANAALWSKYCTGRAESPENPGVKYENPEIMAAAHKLSKVADASFYFYGSIMRAYGLGSNSDVKDLRPAVATNAGVSTRAHAFLVQLCGEFRDRATVMEDKIKWLNNMYFLPVESGERLFDRNRSPWAQMRADDYVPFIEFSKALWIARKNALGADDSFKISEDDVDLPVDGMSVCAVKHIFANYIFPKKAFDDLKSFNLSLSQFQNVNCTADDLASYYDFRGDSNFKPYSPESNGMIWYATSIAGQCETVSKAKPDAKLKHPDCANYFRLPFAARWNAARAGLAAWLLRDRKYDSVFSEEGEKVIIQQSLLGAKAPFQFKVVGNDKSLAEFVPEWKNIPNAYGLSDLGFNALTGLGQPNFKLPFAYERLRDAVNRHTDWYSSAYDDNLGGTVKDQAYSPFVASSYEMNASNGFTQPGTTVSSPSDGRKHWMFVFRVKKANWYHSARLRKGDKVDFDRMWFDETSLGNNGLADSERAWDRLGSPLEGEFDSILYLHNLKTSGELVEESEAQKF